MEAYIEFMGILQNSGFWLLKVGFRGCYMGLLRGGFGTVISWVWGCQEVGLGLL